MSDDKTTMEEQIAQLTRQLNELKSRIESPPSPTVGRKREDDESIFGEPEDISEELISWADRAALLPRLAALCFMLVFALILRTVTDNNLIPTGIGSAIGITYATALMVVSWLFYTRKNSLAPVFAATGSLLLGSIVVETHMKFLSLPLVPAYFTLMGMGVWLTIVSYRFRDVTPVSVGTLSMCLAGAAIDYPHPFFPYLGMILVTANILGFYAATLRRCSWLRWIVLIVTLAMMQLWGMRVVISHTQGVEPTSDLAITWALPFLGIFVLLFPILAIQGIVRSGTERVSRFDCMVPTISIVWGYLVARQVLAANGSGVTMLAILGVSFAMLHFLGGWVLANRGLPRVPGTTSFTFAGGAGLAVSLPDLLGSAVSAAPILSAIAIPLMILSDRWKSGGVRLTSSLLQLVAMMMITISAADPESVMRGGFVTPLCAAAASVIAIYHFILARRFPQPEGSALTDLDRHDITGSLILVAGLIDLFIVTRGVLILAVGMTGGGKGIIQGGQTVAINGAALLLSLIGYRLCSRELRNIAMVITLVAVGKVFMIDLIQVKGVPIVASVLSFGIAATVESIVLGRWKGRCGGGSPPRDSGT